MIWLDVQYLRQISSRLVGFKEKKIGKLFDCKCPICGDSTKKKNKKRGYFYEHKDSLLFKCFNCNASIGFGNFLKDFDKNLYDRYALERYRNGAVHQNVVKPKEDILDTIKRISPVKKLEHQVTDELKCINELSPNHPAVKYVNDRKIPEQYWSSIHFAPKFFSWASKHSPETFNVEKSKKDHPRLVIPWKTKEGKVFSYSARAFGKEEPKYYNIVLDESSEKVYGLDHVDGDVDYVVEGPIDSLFLPNAVAVGTATLYTYQCDGIYIPDRDIRNKEILSITRKLIDSGKRVCLLPEAFPYKDLNEAAQHGLSQDNLVNVIRKNTYQGLEAVLKFSQWRKI